jgi:hypothetical protein
MLWTLRNWSAAPICFVALILTSCAIPPDIREIRAEDVESVRQKVRVRNDLWYAENELSASKRLLAATGRELGVGLRRDLTMLEDSLAEAMAANNQDQSRIVEITALINERVELIGRPRTVVIAIEEFLSSIGSELSPLLNADIVASKRAFEQAQLGDDWKEVRRTGDALINLDSYQISSAKVLFEKEAQFKRLSRYLGSSLASQYLAATVSMRHALKYGTWADVSHEVQSLPAVASYPSEVAMNVDAARRNLETLGPSERASQQVLFDSLDVALHGDSWERALDVSKELATATWRQYGAGEPVGWAPCVRILSIDGGGVRGIIPAMILAEIEQRTNQPIANSFDYVIGTSTGGILALGLTVPAPNKPHAPRYSAQDLVDAYEREAQQIFPSDPLRSIRGIARPKYPPDGLERVLAAKFGDVRVEDALTSVMVTSYALETRQHFVFSSETDNALFYMRDAARATSAAPTYFAPFRFRIAPEVVEAEWKNTPDSPRKRTDLSLIDGGVFANNPTTYGIAQVRRIEERIGDDRRYGERRPWLIISLGTGEISSSASFSDVENSWRWGLVDWASPLVDIMFAESGMTEEWGDWSLFTKLGDYYFRLQPTSLTKATAALDDASPKNMKELRQIARAYVDTHKKTFDKIVALLKRERLPECQRRFGQM